MARKNGAVNQKNYRDRQMAEKRERTLILMIVTDMIHATTIRCAPKVTPDEISFTWTGDQSDYDNLDAFCQEHGFSFAVVMQDYQLRELALLMDKHGLKLAGPPKWTPSAEEKEAFLATLSEGK